MDLSSSFFSDWRWQIKNCVKSIDDLVKLLPINNEISQWKKTDFTAPDLPFSVTPYFVSLMTGKANCPIFLQVTSTPEELLDDPIEMMDPLGEEPRKKIPSSCSPLSRSGFVFSD